MENKIYKVQTTLIPARVSAIDDQHQIRLKGRKHDKDSDRVNDRKIGFLVYYTMTDIIF